MRFSISALVLGLVASSSAAKTINVRPDSEWDTITHGADLIAKRAVGGDSYPEYISDYKMRSRAVRDPSSLGVDTVKQISGYLDDNKQDKHLFFCKSHTTLQNLNNK